jgi:hypothetical protein
MRGRRFVNAKPTSAMSVNTARAANASPIPKAGAIHAANA